MTIERVTTDETTEAVRSLDMEAGRRAFVKALGFGAVGSAIFGAAAGRPAPAEAAGVTDNDILNFALNLEYLESAFYHYAFYGTDVPAKDIGSNPGQISGGRKAKLSSALVKAYAKEIANEELKHVEVLRAVLGSAAVDRPAINIGTAFATAAKAAGVEGGSTFSPYADDTSFLIGSYIFEDVGVTAYHGAAGYLKNKTYLNYAAGILAVEAYHAGIIRTALFAAQSADVSKITTQISQLRSNLSTGKPAKDDLGIGTVDDPSLVPVDAPQATMFADLPGGDAIAYTRQPYQILNIVYGSKDQTPGLFFPKGLNGTLK